MSLTHRSVASDGLKTKVCVSVRVRFSGQDSKVAKLCKTVAIQGSYTHDYGLVLGLVTMAKPASKVFVCFCD